MTNQVIRMVSVVIPVFNEARHIDDLYRRLKNALQCIRYPHEIIFVDDGSRDLSFKMLSGLHAKDSGVRVVRLNRNYGQHAAVVAGMERARGDVIVTLDADLQHPPEEIARVLDHLSAGIDVVGGWRVDRRGQWHRRAASWAFNRVASSVAGIRMRDYGCMLRAYRRSVVDKVVTSAGAMDFVPVLANFFAESAVEIAVTDAPREGDRSRYGFVGLIGLSRGVLIEFIMLHLRVLRFAGGLASVFGLIIPIGIAIRQLMGGHKPSGESVLFGILLFFTGLQMLVLGVVAEYVAQMSRMMRRRPWYIVSEVLE